MNDAEFMVDVTAEDFEERVVRASAEHPVLVDFWAAWCGPCRALAPALEAVVNAHAGKLRLAKVDTDAQGELAARFGIRSLPTVMLFREGRVVDSFMGALPQGRIEAWLATHLGRDSDVHRERAAELLARGRSEAACALLEQAVAEDPDNLAARIELAELYLRAERTDAAAALIERLPAAARDDPRLGALRARLTLADIVARHGARASAEQSGAPGEALARGSRAALAGEHGEALETLLAVLERQPDYDDGAARRAMLAVFALLGNSGELVAGFRRRMASALH